VKGRLLTIAIPTYNRAKILDLSLSLLLPQIDQCREDIEFIISDNNSSDNTQIIIRKNIELFPNIFFINNIQPVNTGYYGNFKSCRNLSNGKYFWLLSDNEHLNSGILPFLIETIKKNQNIGAFYFETSDDNRSDSSYEITKVTNFFASETAYRITLISSVIMLNDKKYDDYLLSKYKENLFLGFLFLCNSLIVNSNIYIINKKIFNTFHTKVTFNVFSAWSKDILECIEYMLEINILNSKTKDIFISGYMKTALLSHVLEFRKKMSGYLNINNIEELRDYLDSSYINCESYQEYVRPFLDPSKVIPDSHPNWIRIKRKTKEILSIIRTLVSDVL
jgi:glycosyltransferase involved in cell wall biosynthesis